MSAEMIVFFKHIYYQIYEGGRGVGARENRGGRGTGGGRRKGGKRDSQSGGNREKGAKFRNIA